MKCRHQNLDKTTSNIGQFMTTILPQLKISVNLVSIPGFGLFNPGIEGVTHLFNFSPNQKWDVGNGKLDFRIFEVRCLDNLPDQTIKFSHFNFQLLTSHFPISSHLLSGYLSNSVTQ